MNSIIKKNILRQIRIKLISYQKEFGVFPNIIKLSVDLAKLFAENNENEVLQIFEIEVEIVFDKKDYIKVGYMR